MKKQDSGDSGNEEPNGEADFYVKSVIRRRSGRLIMTPSAKPDKLTERINCLTTPRDYAKEEVPEGLFDSLPPEGILHYHIVLLHLYDVERILLLVDTAHTIIFRG